MKYLKGFLFLIHFFVGISAVWGGYGIAASNGLGIPLDWIQPVFSSFLVPGVILAVIVGGINLLACFFIYSKNRFWHEVSVTAAFGVIIWIFTQMYIIAASTWLQVVYFTLGALELICVLIFLKYFPQK